VPPVIRTTGRRAAVLAVAAALCLQNVADGERFLGVEEALKVCFPKATFREETIRLTPEQVTAIQKRSDVKVRKPPVRMWTAIQGTNVAGVLFFDQVIGKHELIDYVLAVSPEGAVRQVEIVEYREHYGGKVRDAEWRAQFQGKTASDPVKLNGDIYNITGATLSCRHVTEGVRRLLATFDLVVRPRLSSAGLPNKPDATR
jgi:Na+-translocating ferredoxin:NAD+ oxidoreductase RnfG subunit